MSKARPIHFIPDSPETSDKISEIADKLRVSRNGLLGIAVDFFLPKLESGEVQIVNGRVQFTKPKRKAA